MRILLTIAVLMIPLSVIGFNAVWNFQNERYLVEYLKDLGAPGYNHLLALRFMGEDIVYLFYTGLSIFYLISPAATQKEKALQVLRCTFILDLLLYIPIFILLLTRFEPGWDNVYGYFALIRFGINLFICLILWVSHSGSTIPKIDISNFTVIEVDHRGKRLRHYMIDILFIFLISDTGWGLFVTQEFTHRLMALAVLATGYFLYFFLSESLFRQTPGQCLTGSCIVGNYSMMSTGKAFRRSLVRLIPFDAFSFLWGGNWHHSLSNTSVVRQNSWENLSIEAER